MEYRDIYVPHCDYQILRRREGFCVVCKPEDKLQDKLNLDTVVNLNVLDDEAFENRELTGPVLSKHIYDVGYIRFVRAKHILKQEWSLNYGPTSLPEFLEVNPTITPSTNLTLLYLTPVTYDLRQLNAEYRNPSHYGR